jgi:tRNA-(ms[2]io[6]A)-hydroxylase
MNIAGMLVPTPAAWVDAACAQWQELLIDHAYCEKKAASTALAMIFAYPESQAQNLAIARLAREELKHFEQVTKLMEKFGVPFRRLKPGRYAAGLHAVMRTHEPRRRLDLLLVGALIEGRSCERFRLLAPRLGSPLGEFYAELEASESRHCDMYLDFAIETAAAAGLGDCSARLAELVAVEGKLITDPDGQLRFHSGPPRSST